MVDVIRAYTKSELLPSPYMTSILLDYVFYKLDGDSGKCVQIDMYSFSTKTMVDSPPNLEHTPS